MKKSPAWNTRRHETRGRCLRLESLEERRLLSGWVQGIAGGSDMARDADGNLYIAGNFEGTVDFDPGPGSAELTNAGGSRDSFVARYSPDGTFDWVRHLASSSRTWVMSIVVDSAGSAYVSGELHDTLMLGDTELVPTGENDLFLVQLDTAGDFIRATSIGGPLSTGAGGDLAVDPQGNVYVTWGFQGTVQVGEETLTEKLIGRADFLIAKLDAADWTTLWARRAGGWPKALAVNPDGVYVAGTFEWQACDYGDTILTPEGRHDAFVTKLDPASGTFLWATQVTGSGSQMAGGATLDPAGNLLVVGGAFDTARFGPHTLSKDAPEFSSHYLTKLGPNGDFLRAQWTQGHGQIYANHTAFTTDSTGNVYYGGRFRGLADFDLGPGTAYHSSAFFGAYVLKLDSGGNYLNAWSVPSRDGAATSSVIAGDDGCVYAMVNSSGPAVFPDGIIRENGAYLLKLDPSDPPRPENELPVARPDTYRTAPGMALQIAAPGVLANDTEEDGEPLVVLAETEPSNAMFFEVRSDGSFDYLPALGFTGTDSFTYRAQDLHSESNLVTVTITVGIEPHPGDANLDGVTDVRDFNIWNANKFTSGTDWGRGDFNNDGVTDVRDFNIWNAHKFTSAAVPVPASDAAVEQIVARDSDGLTAALMDRLTWLEELGESQSRQETDADESPHERAVDRLLATYWM